MEHRNGARRSTDSQVTLLRGGLPLGTFAVHNISSGGLAVKAHLADLPHCCLLKVRLVGDDGNPTEVRALVVHQRDGLIGLMWLDHCPWPLASHAAVQTAHAAPLLV